MSSSSGNRFAILHVGILKTWSDIREAEGHNSRLIRVLNIDPACSSKNVDFRPNSDGTLVERIQNLILQAQVHVRPDSVKAFEAVATFSPEMNGVVQVDQWAKDVLKWAEARFGADKIVHAILHLDEKTPHMHFVVVPIVKRSGKRKYSKQMALSYRQLLGGDKIQSAAKLRALQTDFAENVGKKHGLERGIMYSKRKHRHIRELYKAAKQSAQEGEAALSSIRAKMDEFLAETDAPNAREVMTSAGKDTWKRTMSMRLSALFESLNGCIQKLTATAATAWRADELEGERKFFDQQIQKLTDGHKIVVKNLEKEMEKLSLATEKSNDDLESITRIMTAWSRGIPVAKAIEKLTQLIPVFNPNSSVTTFHFPDGRVLEVNSETNQFRDGSGLGDGMGNMQGRKGGRNAIDAVIYLTGWRKDQAIEWIAQNFSSDECGSSVAEFVQANPSPLNQEQQTYAEKLETDISTPDKNLWSTVREMLMSTLQITGEKLDVLYARKVLWANKFGHVVFRKRDKASASGYIAIDASNESGFYHETGAGTIALRTDLSTKTIMVEAPVEGLALLHNPLHQGSAVVVTGKNAVNSAMPFVEHLAKKWDVMLATSENSPLAPLVELATRYASMIKILPLPDGATSWKEALHQAQQTHKTIEDGPEQAVDGIE